MCDFWYEVFVLIRLLGFHQTCCCALWPKISTLVLSVVLEVLWFVQMQLCKPKPCCHVFFLERRGFLLASLPNMPYLSHIFLTVLSWTLSFHMLTEACRLCGEVLVLSDIPLSVTRSDLGLNSLGRPLLGGLVSVLSVFHLWIIFLAVEWWTSDCLEMAVLLFPDWWQQQFLL